MASRKNQSVEPTAKAPVAPEDSLYTLVALQARAGVAPAGDILAYVEGATSDALVTEGAQVSTERINKDAARLLGIAYDWWTRATEPEREPLVGMSTRLLRSAITSARDGQVANAALVAGKSAVRSSRSQRTTEANTVREKAVVVHGKLVRGLRVLAGRNDHWLARIQSADAGVATHDSLGQSLKALAEVGAAMLEDSSPAMVVRRDGAGLTTALLAECTALGVQVTRTGETAGAALSRVEISQADVDRLDGINLLLLAQVVNVFNEGHRTDKTIPKLNFAALRGYFAARRGPRKAPAPTPAEVPPATT